jgi:hypothetical protein
MSSEPTDLSLAHLTDAELKAYQVNKAKWFKGTIAVCVVYGVLALILLFVAIFDLRGRQLLSDNFMPFTVTFVGGMIVVIILLVIQITTFKPKAFNKSVYDKDVCPDYWKAEAEKNELPATTETSDQYLMRTKCVPDTSVFDMNVAYTQEGTGDQATTTIKDMAATDKNVFGHSKIAQDQKPPVFYAGLGLTSQSDSVTKKLSEVSTKMYGDVLQSGSTVASLSNIRCDMLYPELMAKEDELNFKDKPNALRCKYAEVCKIPWTSVCP